MKMMHPKREIDDRTEYSGGSHRVNADVWIPKPVEIGPASDKESGDFTEDSFEDALDRASRPVKGKYADKLPSSEDFIRDKRKEVELEER
jgi:hypothetical protein